MAKINVKELTENLLSDFLRQESLVLWHIDFKKEGKEHVLRVYIDKDDGYVSTDDCEKVSRYLDAKLDEEDPVSGNYYLEVSSPGLDRQLYTIEQYRKYIGSEVEMKLYHAVEGKKKLDCVIKEVGDDELVITDGNNEICLPWDAVAKTNLKIII